MYTEKLRESTGGIIGSFFVKKGEIEESDLEGDLQFVMQSFFYLMETVTEQKELKEFSIYGEEKNFFVLIYSPYIVGVLLECTANIPLVSLMVRKVLETLEQPEVVELSESEAYIPFFDRPKEAVLPNVPAQARQVLQFVDGIRTVRDIIEESGLPSEIVLSIIKAYRRTSVLHYKGL